MKKIKIILADDHRVFLDGLEALFKDHPAIHVVGTAVHGEQVLSLLRANPEIEVAVLDISMPGLDGIETSKKILADYPNVAILILSMHGEYAYVKSLKELGVHGYLLKEEATATLEEAIKTLASGRDYFSSKVTGIVRNGKSATVTDVQFTTKEMEVLCCLGKGWENQKIAEEMHIKVTTVDTHLKSIRLKTGLGSGRALVRYAIDRGFGEKGKCTCGLH